ncbi:hypothetical protein MTZ49_01490 [Entomomonas sp. E2T0]|uniref:hypothetical protein n=1 Tax=Entomomonas sp. E2T0 TaxID=2930213 RepID=UPI0022281E6E|nr:hypothetical protein [Entomomonas sp. E2T0]UYZ84281.1 hypothetical protein MTZ49_01490 [Entomomonas sp. E2T0]
MAFQTGTATDSTQLAHYELLQIIHDLATANGWQAVRYDTTIDNRELILKGTGYSGDDEIYLCFYCYQNANSDYYNLAVGTALGYVPSNTITTQPNVIFSGVPAHNQSIQYWLSVNPQRIAGVLAVGGNTVYESFYVGKYNALEYPHKYPQPLVCIGMLEGAAATRFSDTYHGIGFKGYRTTSSPNYTYRNLKMFMNGAWLMPECWPWNNSYICGTASNVNSTHFRDTEGTYTLQQIELTDTTNGNYGVLDGVAHITGFNNVVTNTVTVGADEWIIFQDVWRTGANDYFAMRAN